MKEEQQNIENKKSNFIIKKNNFEDSFNLEELLSETELQKLKEVVYC